MARSIHHFLVAMAAIVPATAVAAIAAPKPGKVVRAASGAGAAVLDPNADGFVSTTTAGFVADDTTVSEHPYHWLVQAGGEPFGDLQAGTAGGPSDLVDTAARHSAALLFDAAGPGAADDRLLFRLRLGSDPKTSALGYSLLVDTDQKVGAQDPNALPGNPGFEREILVATGGNSGVRVRNVDGTAAGTTIAIRSLASSSQVSRAVTNNGGTPDYFLDGYVLLSNLGLTAASSVRVVAATSASTATALGGTAVDLVGVDDRTFDSDDDGFLVAVQAGPAFTLQSLAADGSLARCADGNVDAGEQCDDGNLVSLDGCSDKCMAEMPAAPAVTQPANASRTASNRPTIVGTGRSGASVSVFVDGEAAGSATVSGGQWSVALSGALADGPHVVTAQQSQYGLTGPFSPGAGFVVDTTPPVSSLNATPEAVSTEVSPTFAFTANEPAIFACATDAEGLLFSPCTSPFSFNLHSEGAAHFWLRVTDLVGNVEEPPRHFTWQFDPLLTSYVQTGDGQAVEADSIGTPLGVRLLSVGGAPAAGRLVTFTVLDEGLLVSASTATTDANGEASVGIMAGLTAGSYGVKASAHNAPDVYFTVHVVATTPTALSVVSGDGQAVVVNGSFEEPLAVRVVDAFGNPAAWVRVSFLVPSEGASAELSPVVYTDEEGIAGTYAMANAISGSFEVEARLPDDASVDFVLTNHAGAPAQVSVVAGEGQRVLVGSDFGTLSVVVSDSFGNLVPGAAVAFSAPSSGPTASCSPASAVTSSQGVASTTATANGISGSFQVTATAAEGVFATFGLRNKPAAPTALAFSPDTGVSPGDALTRAEILTFSGQAEPHRLVALFDADALVGTDQSDDAGHWSLNAALAGDGDHTVTARVVLAEDDTSDLSTQLVIHVDRTPPEAPTQATLSPDSGRLNDDFVSNATFPALTVSAQEGATVTLFRGEQVIGTAVVSGGKATIVGQNAADQGLYAMHLTATDAAGNVSGPLNVTLIIDRTAPEAPTVESGTGLTADTTPSLSGHAEANALLALTVNGTVVASELVVATDGSWSYTFPEALADGDYAISTTAVDVAGNISVVSSPAMVKVDTTEPAEAVVSSVLPDTAVANDRRTNAEVVTVSGVAEAGASVALYDEDALVATLVADAEGLFQTTLGVSEGAHGFTAQATDTAGNLGPTSTVYEVFVDRTAPSAPGVTLSNDTGASDADWYTADAAPMLSGVTEPGATVTVRSGEGFTLSRSAVADAEGVWSLSSGQPKADGLYPMRVEVMDVAGNTGAFTALTLEIDTATPEPTLSFSVDSGAQDGVTRFNTLTFGGQAEAGAVVKLLDGGAEAGRTTAGSDGAWVVAVSGLSDGTHAFEAAAQDRAGNTAQSSGLSVTVDTEAPARPVIVTVTDDTGVPTDRVTYDTTLTLSGSAEAGATLAVLIDGSVAGLAARSDDAWSFVSAPLSDGPHTLTVVATDLAGNASASSDAWPVVVDTGRPDAPVFTAFGSDTGPTGDALTSARQLVLSGTITGDAQLVTVFEGTTLVGTSGVVNGGWSVTTGNLADGPHGFTAISTDLAGNDSALSAVFEVTVDGTAPAAPVVNGFAPDSGAKGDGLTNASVVTLSGTAESGAAIALFDGASAIGFATATNGAWSFTTGTLVEGAHVFTATASDAAANLSEASTVFTVTVDTQPPVAPVIASFSDDSGAANDALTNDAELMLVGSAHPLTSIDLFDGETRLGGIDADAEGHWSFTTATLADGAHAFTAVATDAAANVSESSATLSVAVDTQRPAVPVVATAGPDTGSTGDGITAASSLTFTGSAAAGAVVSLFDGATVVGHSAAGVDGSWTITTPTLTDGTHVFTAKAADTAANRSDASAPVVFLVDTVAPVAPEITSHGAGLTNVNTVALSGLTEAGTVVELFDGSVSLGHAAVTDGSWSFTTTPLLDGTHGLVAVATDVAGNASAASGSAVVVVDTVAPVAASITGWSDDSGAQGDGLTGDRSLTLGGLAEAGSSVTLLDGDVTVVVVTANHLGSWTATTADLGDGAHGFTAIATDGAGNAGPASATVVVTIDGTAPESVVIATVTDVDGHAVGAVTRQQTLVLAGVAEAGTVVEVYGGTQLLGTATRAGDDWSFTTVSLGSGSYAFSALAVDAAGNRGAAGATRSVVIDTDAPASPLFAGLSDDTGLLETDAVTSATLFQVRGLGEDGSVIHLFEGETELGTAIVAGGEWSVALSGVTEGVHVLHAVAIDAVGNQAASAVNLTVVVDVTAPVTPAFASFEPDSGLEGDSLTKATDLNLQGTSADDVVLVKVAVDDGQQTVWLSATPSAGAWSYDASALVSGTVYRGLASAFDLAGNKSVAVAVVVAVDAQATDTEGAFVVHVDTLAPAAPVVTAPATAFVATATPSITGSAPADAVRVEWFLDGTSQGNALLTAGTWSATAAVLTEGPHAFSAVAFDAAGNASVLSQVVHTTVDTVAPAAVVLASMVDGAGHAIGDFSAAAVLTLSGTAESGTTVTLFDGVAVLGSVSAGEGGSWSFTTGTLAEGNHDLAAGATDAAGNVGARSDAVAIVVDTVAPVAPVISVWSADTGALATDGITRDRVLTLSGVAEAGTVVVVSVDGAAAGEAARDGAAWSYTTTALDDGAHALVAVAVDAAGNESTGSTALEVTIDRTAPSAPAVTAISSDTGASATDLRTADTSLTISGSGADDSKVSLYDGDQFVGTAAVSGGTWSVALEGLVDGLHVFSAVAADVAGNETPSTGGLAVVVDTHAPLAAVITSFVGNTGSAEDNLTANSAVTLHGAAEGGATVTVSDGETPVGTVVASEAGAWTLALSGLTHGNHVFRAVATSVAGVSGPAGASFTVGVDLVAPVDPVVSAFSPDSGLVGDQRTNATTLLLSGSTEVGSAVVVFDGSVVLGAAEVSGTGWSFEATGLNAGAHAFQARATDVVGNESGLSATFDLVIDVTAPAAPLLTAFATDSGTPGDRLTSDSAPSLSGTAEAGARVELLVGDVVVADQTATDGTWSLDATPFVDGAHAVRVRATDDAGNVSEELVVSFVIDTEKPSKPFVVSFSEDRGAADGVTSDRELVLTGTAEPGAAVYVTEALAAVGDTVAAANGSWSITTATLAHGSHGFRATAVDAAGNASDISDALTVTVEAPTATSVTVTSGNGQTPTVFTAADALVVTVRDQFGLEMPDVVLSVSAPTGKFVSATSVTTDASGVATLAGNAGTVSGAYTVRLSVSETLFAEFSLTNLPGAPASVAVTSGGVQSTPIRASFGTGLAVSVTDAFGNAVPSVSVAFTVPSSGASAVLSAASATTDAAGAAFITATANNTVGSYAVTASVDALGTTFDLTNEPRTDLRLTVTVPTTKYLVAANTAGVTVTVTVDNIGSRIAAAPSVAYTLPASLVYVSSSLGGACSEAGQDVTCALADLAIGGSEQFTFTVSAASDIFTVQQTVVSMLHTLAVSTATAEETLENNVASATTTAVPGVSRDLAFYKGRPSVIAACVAANNRSFNVGWKVIRDEVADDEVDPDVDTLGSTSVEAFVRGLLNASATNFLTTRARSSLLSARVAAAQQQVVALCNANYLGAPTPSATFFTSAANTQKSTNTTTVNNLTTTLTNFNSSLAAYDLGFPVESTTTSFTKDDPTDPND